MPWPCRQLVRSLIPPFAPGWLHLPLYAGSHLSLGLPLGAALILLCWLRGPTALLNSLRTGGKVSARQIEDRFAHVEGSREDIAALLTVDFFTPIVDDPYDFGRITAAAFRAPSCNA